MNRTTSRHSRRRHRHFERRRRELRLVTVCGAAVALAAVTTMAVELGTEPSGDPSPTLTRAVAESPVSPSITTPSSSTSSTSAVPRPIDEKSVADRGNGLLTVLPGELPDSTGGGRQVTYILEIEGGYGVSTSEYVRTVQTVLTDTRGWETKDKVHFVHLTPEQLRRGVKPQVRISLVSPVLVDRYCAPLSTNGQVSCFNRGRVSLNMRRWLAGAASFGQDLAQYRVYLINHEVGHAIGHNHEPCPGKGKPAPVMLQQTLGLQGCRAWPYPVPPS